MKKSIMAASLIMTHLTVSAQTIDVYIGTYTSKGGSEGIYRSRLDLLTGKLSAPELAVKTPNPSFFVTKGHHLYATAEQKDGMLRAFFIDPQTQKMQYLNEVSSGGSYPCHLAVGNNVLAAANYGNGSVLKVQLNRDGSLSARSEVFQHQGKSVNPSRQSSPHAHWVHLVTDEELWAVDLGLDKVIVHQNHSREIALKPGAGPRHIAFSADHHFAYVINELDNTITVIQDGNIIQTISTLPEGFKEASACAAIRLHPNGKFLYGSNRGHDSLVKFEVDPKKGTLSAPIFQTNDIKWPRDFNLTPDGKYCVVANERGDSIVIFRINQANGYLETTGGKIAIKKPTCVQFVQ